MHGFKRYPRMGCSTIIIIITSRRGFGIATTTSNGRPLQQFRYKCPSPLNPSSAVWYGRSLNDRIVTQTRPDGDYEHRSRTQHDYLGPVSGSGSCDWHLAGRLRPSCCVSGDGEVIDGPGRVFQIRLPPTSKLGISLPLQAQPSFSVASLVFHLHLRPDTQGLALGHMFRGFDCSVVLPFYC
jgi:hypothetical protein